MGEIRGDVEVLGISNLLQMLSMNRCEGFLTIQLEGQKEVLHFLQEGIRLVAGARRTNPLGEILIRTGKITRDQLEVTVEENQLIIRGRQQDDKSRQYIHRGIAARQFQRTFVLADGMEVSGADLKNGLLSIDLVRPELERVVKSISIKEYD